MMRHDTLLAFLIIICAVEASVWPQPAHYTVGAEGGQTVSADWACSCASCNPSEAELLNYNCNRYTTYSKGLNATSTLSGGGIEIEVSLPTQRSSALGLTTDESYSISTATPASSIKISANSIFGVIRSLETVFQTLFFNEERQLTIPGRISIQDKPRFQHRGMLVDTARYFFTADFIKHVLDSMSMSKLNVLHWHVVDSQSFPLVTDVFPALAEQASFPPNSFLCRQPVCNYTKEDVKDIVQYAYQRGIRVVVEIDTPGHSYSWGLAYPNVTVGSCYSPILFNKDSIPMNPLQPFAHEVVNAVIEDVAARPAAPFVDQVSSVKDPDSAQLLTSPSTPNKRLITHHSSYFYPIMRCT